jgi:hypothetical protein
MENNNVYVIISKAKLKKLLEADAKLSALEAAGVDNWQGYEYAISSFENEFGTIEEDANKNILRYQYLDNYVDSYCDTD